MQKLAFIIFLLPSIAFAGAADFTNSKQVDSSLMASALALTSSRTITIPVYFNYSKLRFGVYYTYSAATSVTLTPTCRMSPSGTASAPNTRNCVSGACEGAPMTDVETGTASFNRNFEYDVRGCYEFVIVISGGGSPAAGDVITTEAVLLTGE